jgi:putative proteasome-type protease
MLSDTRTNAGVDNVARFRKMFTWEVPGERAICLMTAGNLSITQGVVTRLETEINRSEAGDDVETLLNAPSMFRVAQIVGTYMREMHDRHREALIEQGSGVDSTILVCGQRAGGAHRLFLVYSAGNFIEAGEDTPYFQIGEHKYGKPILDRVIAPDTSLRRALKAAFVSMDSTLRSNLSVGLPLDLAMIRVNEQKFAIRRRIEVDDEEFTQISHMWSDALREAFRSLPEIGED